MAEDPEGAVATSGSAGRTSRLAVRLTELALEVDRVALQLAAEEELDTETLVPGAMLMLTGAVDKLQRSVVAAEFLSPARRAEYLAAIRPLAGPVQPGEAS